MYGHIRCFIYGSGQLYSCGNKFRVCTMCYGERMHMCPLVRDMCFMCRVAWTVCVILHTCVYIYTCHKHIYIIYKHIYTVNIYRQT